MTSVAGRVQFAREVFVWTGGVGHVERPLEETLDRSTTGSDATGTRNIRENPDAWDVGQKLFLSRPSLRDEMLAAAGLTKLPVRYVATILGSP